MSRLLRLAEFLGYMVAAIAVVGAVLLTITPYFPAAPYLVLIAVLAFQPVDAGIRQLRRMRRPSRR